MTPLDIREEKLVESAHYKALKAHLGSLMLENVSDDPAEIAYYNRKFYELQQKLRKGETCKHSKNSKKTTTT